MTDKVSDEFFTDEIVDLDNMHFDNCLFVGTTLHYQGTGEPPIFENCNLSDVTDIYFNDVSEEAANLFWEIHRNSILKDIPIHRCDPYKP